MTPGKFIISPNATISSFLSKYSISEESKTAPDVSNPVAGTQDGAVKKKLKGTCFAFSIIASTPSIPKTLAIS